MFTAKIMRRNASGEQLTYLYQAKEVDILADNDNLKRGEYFVNLKTPDNAMLSVTVTNNKPEGDCSPCFQVVIENAAGKTTELIRPYN